MKDKLLMLKKHYFINHLLCQIYLIFRVFLAPVSFSIKKHKEHEAPKEIKSALPVEESDDEDEEETETSTQVTPTTNSSNTPLSQTPPVIQSVVAVTSTVTVPVLAPVTCTEIPLEHLNPESNSPETEIKTVALCKNGVIDVDDPILEMIDLTDDSEEKRDAKRGVLFYKIRFCFVPCFSKTFFFQYGRYNP